jgi:hypothetical protein
MSELTLLQKAMRVVEEHEPSLFDVHTNKGRDFIRAMHNLLAEWEKEGDDMFNSLMENSNTVLWIDEIKKDNQ